MSELLDGLKTEQRLMLDKMIEPITIFFTPDNIVDSIVEFNNHHYHSDAEISWNILSMIQRNILLRLLTGQTKKKEKKKKKGKNSVTEIESPVYEKL